MYKGFCIVCQEYGKWVSLFPFIVDPDDQGNGRHHVERPVCPDCREKLHHDVFSREETERFMSRVRNSLSPLRHLSAH